MTKIQVIRAHRRLWKWLSRKPAKEKVEWPEWDSVDMLNEKYFYKGVGWVPNGCFLCEYYYLMNSCGIDCESCPLGERYDGNGDEAPEYGCGRIFAQWQIEGNFKVRSKLAWAIRDKANKEMPTATRRIKDEG